MGRLVILIYLLFNSGFLFASCSEVPTKIKDDYATKMHFAFLLQSQGKSTLAQFNFETAREEAKKAGENVLRLIAIEKLFIWYRMYGSSLGLFAKNPTGNERIRGEYKPRASRSPPAQNTFESEWGKTPEQAALVRSFMYGVGEVIAGIFCATVNPGFGGSIGYVAVVDGTHRIFDSLNTIWANGHPGITALHTWENTSLKKAVDQ